TTRRHGQHHQQIAQQKKQQSAQPAQLSRPVKPRDKQQLSRPTTPDTSASRTSDELITLSFTVADTGTGIEPDDYEKIFEPFAQSQSGRVSQEGTGLGLSICREFVQLMGGQIHLENRTDGKTGAAATFTIRAKVSTAQTSDRVLPERGIVGLAVGQPSYRILVVDDKRENRQLLCKLLEPVGLEMKTANDGQAAVQIAKDWQPHLIWMDLRMPVMSGIEATREIRQLTAPEFRQSSDTPVVLPKIVALSATSFVGERADAIAAGCDTFIAKPFQASEIFDCMAKQLNLSYRYADDSENTTDSHWEDSPRLDPDALNNVSPTLLKDLESAVLRLHWDKILETIEKISREDEALAEVLNKTVHNFQYGHILEAVSR
ncbi:MAG: response regulator, partial [Cyanobacteria bacterium J06649_4]